MKRLLAIFVVFLFPLQMALQAQELTNKERRHINSKLLDLLDQYETACSLSDEDAVYTFSSLFKSEDAEIYCDLMGTENYLQKISVKDYLKESRQTANRYDVLIYDVKKGDFVFSEGCWNTSIAFKKSMSFVDRNSVFFSTNEYYNKDRYDIVLKISYNTESDECLITSIDGNINSAKVFPKGKFVVVNKKENQSFREKEYEDMYLGGGKPVEYNNFGQAILDKVPDFGLADDIEIRNTVIESNTRYDIVDYSFNPLLLRAKAHLGFAPMAYSVKASDGWVKRGGSSAFEVGVAWGGTFKRYERAKLAFYIGAGVSTGNLGLELKDTLTFEDQKILIKRGDFYQSESVKYEIAKATESLRFTDIFVPIYLELEYPVGDRITISGDLGFKTYFAVNTAISDPYTIVGKRTIGDEEDSINKKINQFFNPVTSQRTPVNISMMINAGVDVRIIGKRLFATAKLGFEQGLSPIMRTDGCIYNDIPVIYHKGQDIARHSLISNINVMRQALWVEFGVKYKM